MFGCTTLAVLTLIAAPVPAKMPTPIHYGKPFAVVKPIRLSDLTKVASKKLGTKVQVVGSVHRVCTKKGCWIELRDGDAHVRVWFRGYRFFVPTTVASGTVVVAKGILATDEHSKAKKAHLEKESATVPKSGKELKIVAEGVAVGFTNR